MTGVGVAPPHGILSKKMFVPPHCGWWVESCREVL